jgi:hypothetical protein
MNGKINIKKQPGTWLVTLYLRVDLFCGYKPLELFVTSDLPAAEHLRQ